MATKKTTADKKTATILNKIYNSGTPAYQSTVGQFQIGDDLSAYGEPIINYTSVKNEFISNLIQLVAFPLFQSHMWENRLSILKKGSKPYGFDIEDIYTNPVKPTPYNANDFSRVLKGTKQDTITAFYRENRHDVFQKTIINDMLRGAFQDSIAFTEFIDTLVTTMYAGNEIAEFNLAKRSVNECYEKNMFKTSVAKFDTADSIADTVEKIKNCYDGFQFPSSNYNNYAEYSGTNTVAEVWSKPNDIIIIASVKALNAIKVKYLATIFNLSEVEFRERLITIDSFDWVEYETAEDGVTGQIKAKHNSNIEFMICDVGMFQIYDTMQVSTDFFNSGNLATNYFLHVWQTYGIRPWANCMIFINDKTNEITKVTPSSTELTSNVDSVEIEFKNSNDETIAVTEDTVNISIFNVASIPVQIFNGNEFFDISIVNGLVEVKCKESLDIGDYLITIECNGITASILYNKYE